MSIRRHSPPEELLGSNLFLWKRSVSTNGFAMIWTEFVQPFKISWLSNRNYVNFTWNVLGSKAMSNVLPGLFFQDTGLATVKSVQNVRSFIPQCLAFPSPIYEDVEDGGGVWWWWCAENVLWANSLRWLIGTCPLETSATGSMCRTRNSKTSLLFPRPKSTISKYPLFPAISSISRICCKELAETGPQLLGKNNQAGNGWRQQWREHRWRARWSVRSRSFRWWGFLWKLFFFRSQVLQEWGERATRIKKE